MAIKFLSSNRAKHSEYLRLLKNVELVPCDLLEIQSIDPTEVVRAKLQQARLLVDGPIIIDDTGLHVEALNGFPGALVKWIISSMGVQVFAEFVISQGNTRAITKTTIGYSARAGQETIFEGTCAGQIVLPRGDRFGWDPIFQPDGYTATFAELTEEQKDRISPRGRAATELKKQLTG